MKYVIDGFTSQETIDFIESTSMKKFIHELNFKFGVKAIETQKLPNYNNNNKTVLLTEKTGTFVIATAWIEDGEYFFRSFFHRKDRGRSAQDRETFYSKKLSNLMQTINKNNLVPDEGYILANYSPNFNSAIAYLKDSHGSANKIDELSVSTIHGLLKYALGETTELNNLEICKKVLDKYNQADRIEQAMNEDVERFFSTYGFYVIGADGFNHLIVGKIKMFMENGMRKYQVLDNFVRVKDLSKHEHLLPIMLMQKVYHEQQGKYYTFWGNYIPPHNGILKDFDIIQVSNDRPATYKFLWTFIPCLSVHQAQ